MSLPEQKYCLLDFSLKALLQQLELKHDKCKAFLCGHHSNIPMCCILWYLGNWQEFLFWLDEVEVNSTDDGNGNTELIPYHRKTGIWNANEKVKYIPCSDCLVKLIGGMKPNTIWSCKGEMCKD